MPYQRRIVLEAPIDVVREVMPRTLATRHAGEVVRKGDQWTGGFFHGFSDPDLPFEVTISRVNHDQTEVVLRGSRAQAGTMSAVDFDWFLKNLIRISAEAQGNSVDR